MLPDLTVLSKHGEKYVARFSTVLSKRGEKYVARFNSFKQAWREIYCQI